MQNSKISVHTEQKLLFPRQLIYPFIRYKGRKVDNRTADSISNQGIIVLQCVMVNYLVIVQIELDKANKGRGK